MVDGPYTSGVTNDLGGARINDGTLATDNSTSVDRNLVE